MKRIVEYKGSRVVCEVASDVWKYDTIEVEDGASTLQWFVTRQNKGYQLANFEGDQSLVPEQRLFECLAIVARIYLTPGDAGVGDAPTVSDAKTIFETGYFEFQIQQVITDRDNFFRLIGGGDIFPVAAAAPVAFMGDGAWPNVRKYAVSRIVPGGRSIEFFVYWPTPVALEATRKVQIAMYGYELIPKGKA
jgi:hypothetical protein